MSITKSEARVRRLAEFAEKASKGFVPGDKVWVIDDCPNIEQCPVCLGEKKVTVVGPSGSNAQEVKCPHCGGVGRKYVTHKEIVEKELTSVEVTFSMTDRNPSLWEMKTCVCVDGAPYFYYTDVFRTKEEAEEALAAIEEKTTSAKLEF